MPNYVRNIVEFKNKKKLESFLKAIREENADTDFSFNWLIPMPSKEENCDPKYIVNKDSHVMPLENKEWFNWYDWCLDFWGTKWDAMDSFVDNNFLEFTTAWDTPIPIFRKMVELFPDTYFSVKYADEDIGNSNCGIIYYKDKEEGLIISTFEDSEKREAFGEELWGYR